MGQAHPGAARGAVCGPLAVDVVTDGLDGGAASGQHAVGRGPEVLAPQSTGHFGPVLLPYHTAGVRFDRADEGGQADPGRVVQKQVQVICLAVGFHEDYAVAFTNLAGGGDQLFSYPVGHYPTPVFRDEHHMGVQTVNHMSAVPEIVSVRRHNPYCKVMAIKQRLFPRSGAEHEWLGKHCSETRAVKNALLEQFRMYDPALGPTPGPVQRMRQLAEARQALPWLGEGSSAVQQQAVRDFDRAATNFFEGTHRYPTWWKAGLDESFKIRDLRLRRVNHRWGETLIPKAGWVRFRITRPWPELQAATSARVKRDRAGRWTISFTTPPPAFERTPTGRAVGLDRGAINSLATSDGELLAAPVWTDGEKARLLGLEQQASRQARHRKRGQKPSEREQATRRKIARLHARLADRRTDWVEQTTTRLVRDHDLIVVEALNAPRMVRKPAPKPDAARAGAFLPNRARAKAKLNRMIHASLWGRVERRLMDKTVASGSSQLRRVNPAYTSQQCNVCGHTAPENRNSQAVFRCIACGHGQHADINAAINILRPKLRVGGGC